MVIFILLSSPTLLFGYTDPGSGVLVYQALLASFAGAAWTARRFLRRFFSKESSGQE